PSDASLALPERHLGLRTADQASDSAISGWGTHAAAWLDLDTILTIARAAPALPAVHRAPVRVSRPIPCRLGVALDEAFHFYYDANLRRLEQPGVELVYFSPLADARPPTVDGLYFGGGYPELFAERLSANQAMIEAVRAFAAAQ